MIRSRAFVGTVGPVDGPFPRRIPWELGIGRRRGAHGIRDGIRQWRADPFILIPRILVPVGIGRVTVIAVVRVANRQRDPSRFGRRPGHFHRLFRRGRMRADRPGIRRQYFGTGVSRRRSVGNSRSLMQRHAGGWGRLRWTLHGLRTQMRGGRRSRQTPRVHRRRTGRETRAGGCGTNPGCGRIRGSRTDPGLGRGLWELRPRGSIYSHLLPPLQPVVISDDTPSRNFPLGDFTGYG